MVCQSCGADWSKHGASYGYSDGKRYYCKECGSRAAPVKKSESILIIGDLHVPFEHENYLDFVVGLKEKYNISDDNVYSAGDIVDNHAISFHASEPGGMSAGDELRETINHLQPWYDEFPKMKIATGNHDKLSTRVAKANGLPAEFVKGLNDIYKMPEGWEFRHEWWLDKDTKLFHGVGFSGKYPGANASQQMSCNIIMGHIHTSAAVHWAVNERTKFYGMTVGTGIDRNKYAFDYAKAFARKPIVSAGVLLDGKTPLVELMEL